MLLQRIFVVDPHIRPTLDQLKLENIFVVSIFLLIYALGHRLGAGGGEGAASAFCAGRGGILP